MFNVYTVFMKALSLIRDFVASVGAFIREAFDDSALNSKNTDSQRKDRSDDDDHFFLPPA